MTETLDISALADAVASATAPPPPLPGGWLLKASRSNPGYYYYYHMETGMISWQPPAMERQPQVQAQDARQEEDPLEESPTHAHEDKQDNQDQEDKDPEDADDRASKRRKAPPAAGPKEVRVLHILKKHKGSRRPQSWRQPKITQTLEEAKEELQGLLEILQEEEENANELKATFEELARTESDCSSAKRGGDLGFFGRRKMQPAFEEASFALNIGELTKQIVETSSGAHLILRIG
jgi:NIMA-interacting peptidyl-prolyl cis-trans isomerase 1